MISNFSINNMLTILIFLLSISSLYSQTGENQKLKLFVEGSTVDFNYIREHTGFVDFVNESSASDVHVIISDQAMGGGGTLYTLNYWGKNFQQINKLKLTCPTSAFDTQDHIRKKLTTTFHNGLLLYRNEKQSLNFTKILNDSENKTIDKENIALETYDPWHQWVFRIGANGGFSGEEQKQNYNYSIALRANKYTKEWKLINKYDYWRSEGTIKKDNGDKINTLTIDQDADIRFVYSLDPKWSIGLFLEGTQSTYNNLQMSLEATPAIEYNIYPWDESNQRKFTFGYFFGTKFNKYYEATILNKNSELLWIQGVELNLEYVETWGEINASLEGGNYFPGFDNYYFEVGLDLYFRITNGISINFNIQAESIHNQVYLPASELSDEELFLNTRKLPSTFEYSGGIGISFQFGSIYNNIVNERL